MKKIKYYLYRILAEIFNPRRENLRALKQRIFGMAYSLSHNAVNTQAAELTTYIVDFDSFPYSFNICELLLLAEIKTIREKQSGYRLIFNLESLEKRVLNELKGVSNADREESNRRKFWNQILASLALSPSLKDFVILSDRSAYRRLDWNPSEPKMYNEVFHKQPPDLFELYTLPENELNLGSLGAPKVMIEQADEFFSSRSSRGIRVTFVLRTQTWDPARNSNLNEWKKAALDLQSRGACVTIIPDSDRVFTKNLASVESIVLRDACWDVKLRMAIYEKSDIVLGTHGGALSLGSFSKSTRVVAMNRYPEGSIVNHAMANRLALRPGRLVGRPMPFFKDMSCVEPDTRDNILMKIEEFLAEANLMIHKR